MPDWVLDHIRFPRIVASRFLDKCSRAKGVNGSDAPAIMQLVLLKNAIKEAACEISTLQPVSKTEDQEDKVGITMALLRALEFGRANSIKKWLHRLPEAQDIISLDNPQSWGEDSRRCLRQLAHSTAKEQAIAELNEIGAGGGTDDEEEKIDDGDVRAKR